MYNQGISKEAGILDMAIEHKLIEKAGAWFSYNEEKISQGREGAIRYLAEKTDVRDKLEKQIRENTGLKPV